MQLDSQEPEDLQKILTQLKDAWFYGSTEKFCEFTLRVSAPPIPITGEIPKVTMTLATVRLVRHSAILPNGTMLQVATVEPSSATANNRMLQELLWVSDQELAAV